MTEAATSEDSLGQALASLAPALEILERFHHRNKNQHRLSKWWAHADMLRRHLRKLLAALDGRLDGVERLSKSSGSAKAKEKKRRVLVEDDGIEMRAAFVRTKLVPGAYLAFTQLTADRQFAHLGLMLLGILAQADKAVSPFAPSLSGSSRDSSSPGIPEQTPENEDHHRPAAIATPFTDVGIAVSRDEVVVVMADSHLRDQPRETTEAVRGSSSSAPRDPQRKNRESEEEEEKERSNDRLKKKKKKTAGGDEFDDIFGSLEGSSSKRPKKKKAGGDEFDGIFGSLEKSPGPPKKKKRRKKGDEFDNIFSGL